MHNHKKPKYTSKCTKSVHGEEAPFKESRTQSLCSRYGELYNLPRWDLGVAGHLNPVTYNYKLAKRLIAKYVNRHINLAYSDYCKKCKSRQKCQFWDLLGNAIHGSGTFEYHVVDSIIRRK